MSTRFDPRPHLRQLENGSLYLDIKWRLHWLRSEHPDARIETELVSLEGDSAVCKAVIHVPDGGSATAHGSASGGSPVEQAESRAIGRALVALGYGAEFADEDPIQARGAERPVSLVRQPAPIPEHHERQERGETSAPPVQLQQPERPPRPVRRDDDAAEPPPLQRQPREIHEAPPAPQAAPATMSRGSDLREQVSQEPTAETSREDVSWTRFWEWARRSGYRDASHLKELLGVEVSGLTPREVRAHIKRYEMDHPSPSASEEE
ncbi:MAG TPA: hypothetical protein VMM78_12450 [Thermomicrobiales bacterium]|nr:hypothetical protein [Thermomicrobiales bacterium]